MIAFWRPRRRRVFKLLAPSAPSPVPSPASARRGRSGFGCRGLAVVRASTRWIVESEATTKER